MSKETQALEARILRARKAAGMDLDDDEVTSTTPPPPPPQRGSEVARDAPSGILKTVDDVARSIADVLSFGYADELAAKMNELLGGGKYKELHAAEQARDEQIPLGVKIPSMVAGAAIPALVSGGATLPATAGRIGQAMAKHPYLTAIGKAGGYTGGYASGSGQGGLLDRLKTGAESVPYGLATGGLLYPAIKGAGWVGGKIWDRLATQPPSAALRKILENLRRDDLTPNRVGARLENLRRGTPADAPPRASIADAGGENVRLLAAAAASQPGPARRSAAMLMENRARGEAPRLEASFRQGLGAEDFFAMKDRLIETLKTHARPYYEQAYQLYNYIQSPALARILSVPAAKEALGKARDMMRNDLSNIPRATDEMVQSMKQMEILAGMKALPAGVQGYSLRTLDYAKRALDDQIDSLTRSGAGNEARIITGLKNELLKVLDKSTGGNKSPYASARRIWEGDKTVLDAVDNGRKVFSLRPEQIRRDLRDIPTAPAREAYRAGAMEAIAKRIQDTKDVSAASYKFLNPADRGRFRALFPDNASYITAMRSIMREARMAGTKNIVTKGSPTAERIAGQRDIGVDPSAVQAVADRPVRGMVEAVVNWMRRPDPKMAEELGKRLFTADPAKNQETIRLLMEKARSLDIGSARGKIFRDALLRLSTIATAVGTAE